MMLFQSNHKPFAKFAFFPVIIFCLTYPSCQSTGVTQKPVTEPIDWASWELDLNTYRLDKNVFYKLKGCDNNKVKVKNVANQGNASSTSTYDPPYRFPSMAIDGRMKTEAWTAIHGSIKQSWTLDLGVVYTVMRIEIYRGKGYHLDFEVYVAKTENKWNIFQISDENHRKINPVVFKCQKVTLARYIKIAQSAKLGLKLAEVRVYVPKDQANISPSAKIYPKELQLNMANSKTFFRMQIVPKNIKHRNFREKIKQLKCATPVQTWKFGREVVSHIYFKSILHRNWINISGSKADYKTIWRDYKGRTVSKYPWTAEPIAQQGVRIHGSKCLDYVGEFMCQISVLMEGGLNAKFTQKIHFTKKELGCIEKKTGGGLDPGLITLIVIPSLVIPFIVAAVLWNLVWRKKAKGHKHAKKIDKVLFPVTVVMKKLPGLKDRLISHGSISKIEDEEKKKSKKKQKKNKPETEDSEDSETDKKAKKKKQKKTETEDSETEKKAKKKKQKKTETEDSETEKKAKKKKQKKREAENSEDSDTEKKAKKKKKKKREAENSEDSETEKKAKKKKQIEDEEKKISKKKTAKEVKKQKKKKTEAENSEDSETEKKAKKKKRKKSEKENSDGSETEKKPTKKKKKKSNDVKPEPGHSDDSEENSMQKKKQILQELHQQKGRLQSRVSFPDYTNPAEVFSFSQSED